MIADHVYHVGFLAVDREDNAKLHKLATDIWNRAAAGKVVLYQRRLDDGVFEYHARAIKGA